MRRNRAEDDDDFHLNLNPNPNRNFILSRPVRYDLAQFRMNTENSYLCEGKVSIPRLGTFLVQAG
jgi:hypothetical protein